jgi:hypothetical protein
MRLRMTDYVGIGSRFIIILRAVKFTVAKFLPHSSTCNTTSWLGLNSRLATSIKKMDESEYFKKVH